MRCAMEAVALAAINKANIEAEERARVAGLMARSQKDTLAFIEGVISPKLERDIAKGWKPSASFEMGTFIDGGYTFCGFLENEMSRGRVVKYADGTISEIVNRDRLISLEILEVELAKYCYKLTTRDHWFKTYGCGDQKGVRIYIDPAPACL